MSLRHKSLNQNGSTGFVSYLMRIFENSASQRCLHGDFPKFSGLWFQTMTYISTISIYPSSPALEELGRRGDSLCPQEAPLGQEGQGQGRLRQAHRDKEAITETGRSCGRGKGVLGEAHSPLPGTQQSSLPPESSRASIPAEGLQQYRIPRSPVSFKAKSVRYLPETESAYSF